MLVSFVFFFNCVIGFIILKIGVIVKHKKSMKPHITGRVRQFTHTQKKKKRETPIKVEQKIMCSIYLKEIK